MKDLLPSLLKRSLSSGQLAITQREAMFLVSTDKKVGFEEVNMLLSHTTLRYETNTMCYKLEVFVHKVCQTRHMRKNKWFTFKTASNIRD